MKIAGARLALAVALLALGACHSTNPGGLSSDAGTNVDGGTTDGGTTDGGTHGITQAPSAPPAQICGSDVLKGPDTAPSGAVVINLGDDLQAAVDNHGPGTTFWLAPGTHTLGTGEFDQVIPQDNDVFIGAPGAILDGQHLNRYAFTQHAKNVVIRYLTIQNFGAAGDNNNEGVVNHDSADGWTLEYNTIQHNAGAGMMIGSNDVVRYNCISENGQYAFNAYSDTGPTSLVLDHNEITGNNTDDWETRQPGCGCTGGGKFWAVRGATITNNWVHDNRGPGLWADTNDVGFDVEGNYIADNDGVGFFYEISYNALVRYNTFLRNANVEGPTNPGFPTGAIYLSESGGDSRVSNAFGYSSIEIADNVFTDNWSGVVLWENADRFCNSPDNSSSDECTLVGNASLTTCVDGQIQNEPYYSDCRWKTQNVSVHDNVFSFDPAHIGSACTKDNSCGLQAIFSNWGTDPAWSPYQGDVVENAITTAQHNVFAHNQYTGPWNFMIHDQGQVVDTAAWQGAPYQQDTGSTFH